MSLVNLCHVHKVAVCVVIWMLPLSLRMTYKGNKFVLVREWEGVVSA